MDNVVNGFTVCVLTYGDHLDLVKRCLGSIMNNLDPALVPDIRIGLNECSNAVRDYVYARATVKPAGTRTLVYDSAINRLKYPVMRKMLYDDAHPIVTPFTMWFDDDSCLTGDASWWTAVHRIMQQADMLGAVYTLPLSGKQALGITRQPWYNGQQLYPGYRFRFATGGWWCARTSILRKHDYPFKDITHNGGDIALGEMIRQQGYRLQHFRTGLWINADADGRESKAPRRGVSSKPVWYAYDPKTAVDYSHHDFVLAGVEPNEWATAVATITEPDAVTLDYADIRPKGKELPARKKQNTHIRLPGL